MSKRFQVHERGPRFQMMDGVRRHRDELITTNMRIGAEPAPAGPDLGVIHDGSGSDNPSVNIMATQDDISDIQSALAENGLISKQDASAIQAILVKYSGRSGGQTNQAGISTADANQQVRNSIAVIQNMQRNNDAAWKNYLAALR